MVFTRSVVVGVALAALAAVPAQAASELSVSQRLEDRREVAAGTRAQVLGFEDGRFYANGWHITGEMGGIVTPPLKLLDSRLSRRQPPVGRPGHQVHERAGLRPLRAALDRRHPARPDRCRAGRPARRPDRPQADQPVAAQQDRQGDGRRAFRADDAVPVGLLRNGPERERQRAGSRCLQRAQARLPRHRAASGRVRATTPTPRSWAPTATRSAAGPDPATMARSARAGVAPPTRRRQPMPSECDDGPFGKGTGGRLRYKLKLKGGRATTLWIAVAGSENSRAEAREEFRSLIADPAGALAAKVALAPRAGALVEARPAGRPDPGGLDRLGQAEPRRSLPALDGPRYPLDQAGQGVDATRARSHACAGSEQASPTTRGCSPSTAPTPPTRRSRSASSA